MQEDNCGGSESITDIICYLDDKIYYFDNITRDIITTRYTDLDIIGIILFFCLISLVEFRFQKCHLLFAPQWYSRNSTVLISTTPPKIV